jgi:hypothetical protein
MGEDPLGNSIKMTHSAQKFANSLHPKARLEKQRTMLISKLREAQNILLRGGTSLGFLVRYPIQGSFSDLQRLEARVMAASTWEEMNPLLAQCQVALGYRK